MSFVRAKPVQLLLFLGLVFVISPWRGEAKGYPATKAGLAALVAADAAMLPGPEAAALWKIYRDWEMGVGVTCDQSGKVDLCQPDAKGLLEDIQAHVFRTNGFVIDRVEWSDTLPAYIDDGAGHEVRDTEPVELSYVYPQIVAPKFVVADRFNEDVVEFSDQLWGVLGGPPPSTPDDDTDQDVKLDYVQNIDPIPGVISVTFTWGAHQHGVANWTYGTTDFNWDVAHRRPLEAGDLFDVKTDWKLGLAEAGLAAFRKENPEYFEHATADDVESAFCDPNMWAFSKAGLRIDTQEAMMWRYVAGSPSAVVPWVALRGYLRGGGLGG